MTKFRSVYHTLHRVDTVYTVLPVNFVFLTPFFIKTLAFKESTCGSSLQE